MTEIELLEKIFTSLRVIQFAMGLFIGTYLWKIFSGK